MPIHAFALAVAICSLGALAAAEPIASISAPPGLTGVSHPDRDINVAADGSLRTAWHGPDGQPGATIAIDLGEAATVAALRLAGDGDGGSQLRARADGLLVRRIAGVSVWAQAADDAWIPVWQDAQAEAVENEPTLLRFAAPVTTRRLELRQKWGCSAGNVIVEIAPLAGDGSVIPAFARRVALNGLLLTLCDRRRDNAYVRRSQAWLAEQGADTGLVTADDLDQEAAALEERLRALGDGAALPELGSAVAALAPRISARRVAADVRLQVQVMPALVAATRSKLAAMGSPEAQAADLARLQAIAAAADPALAAEFDLCLDRILDAWAAWCQANHRFIRRDGRFFATPDGRRLIPFGFNYYPTMFVPSLADARLVGRAPSSHVEAQERDFRNLRAWGFNAVRLQLRTDYLDADLWNDRPLGQRALAYLAHVRQVLGWARRYDIAVQLDLHGPSGIWPQAGVAGAFSELIHSPYYRLAYPILAELGKGQPHVIGWELVANECGFHGLNGAIQDTRVDRFAEGRPLRAAWEGWLVGRYGSEAGIAAAWGATADGAEANRRLRLAADGPIADPLALLVAEPGLDPAQVTRTGDYLRCSSELYARQWEELRTLIQGSDPEHLFTFKVHYDLGKAKTKDGRGFATQGRWYSDIRPAASDAIGDHYGNELMWLRFPATGLPWYAGETWITNPHTSQFAQMMARGGGAFGWVLHDGDTFQDALGFDHWLNDSWRAWERSAAVYAAVEPEPLPSVAVINSAISPETGYARLASLFQRMDVRFAVVSDLAVEQDPGLLDRYRAVVLNLDRMDPAVVRAALAKPGRNLLLLGRQDRDGAGRRGTGSGAALVGAFYRDAAAVGTVGGGNLPQPLSLVGPWSFRTDPAGAGDAAGWARLDAAALGAMAGWDTLPAPGFWEREEISRGRYAGYDGLAWYARAFDLPEALRGRDLAFVAGAIDDTDNVSINGEQVGATGHDVPGYWGVSRRYRVPARLLKPAGNVVVVRVMDDKGNGGLAAPPLELQPWSSCDATATFATAWGGIAAGESLKAGVAFGMPALRRDGLAPGAEALAGDAAGGVLLARRDRALLYLGGDGLGLDLNNRDDERLLAGFLREAGEQPVWPVTRASANLEVFACGPVVLVVNVGKQDYAIRVADHTGGRRVERLRLVAPPFRDPPADAAEVVIPPGTYLAVFLAPP